MRAIGFVAFVSGLIAAAPMSAADQTIIESFSVTIPNSVVPDSLQHNAIFSTTPFPLFAPTTGTLDAVRATISGSISVASLVENPDVIIGLLGFSQENNIDSTEVQSGMMIDLSLSGEDINPLNYIGVGNGELTVQVRSADVSTPNTSVINSDGPLSGSITYTYALPTATPAVPESSTWTMMALGFTGLALAGYRARKGVAIAA